MNYPQGQQFPPNQPPQGPQRPRWTQDRNALVIAGIAAIALLVVLLIVVVVAITRTGNDTTSTAATVTAGAATTTAKGKATSTPTADVAPDEFAPTAPGTYDAHGPKQWRPKGVKASDPATGGLIFRFASPDKRLRCEASKRKLVCQYTSRTDAEARGLDQATNLGVCLDAAPTTVYDAVAFTLSGAPGQAYGSKPGSRNPNACKTSGPANWPDDLQIMSAGTFAWLPSPNGDARCEMAASSVPGDQGGTRSGFGITCATTSPEISNLSINASGMS